MRREKETDPFYSSGAWRAAREQALERDLGRCVWCREAGRHRIDRHGRRLPVRAEMVHHLKPRREYPELALELTNLVSLCHACHDEAHPEKRMGRRKERPPTPAERMGIRFEQL